MLRKLKDNSKDRSWIIEAALAIFLPLIIFACSYYLGVKETKIPVEITKMQILNLNEVNI